MGFRHSFINSLFVATQLQSALDEASAVKVKLREVETELAASKERCSDQAEDLFKKSGM
jgi:hypothetical protein